MHAGIKAGISVGVDVGLNPDDAAPVVVTHRQGFSSTGNQATYTTASFTIPANELGLMWVLSALTGGPQAPTFGGSLGGTWTELGSGVAIDADRMLRCYRSLQGTSRTGTVQVTHAVAHESCAVQVVSFAGVPTGGTNGANAVVQSGTNSVAAGTALAVTLSAFGGARNVCAAAIGADVNSQFNPGSGFTELNEQGQTALDIRIQVQTAVNDATADWTFSTRDAAAIAVEVAAA